MHIVHLVLYTEGSAHDQAMMQLQRTVYDWGGSKRLQYTVQTIYYTYSSTVTAPTYSAEERVLRLPGTESYIPGILNKTWDAFRWAAEHLRPFTYLVRSNTSTLLNFHNLVTQLRDTPIEYGGVHTFSLTWLDPKSGIVDRTHFGTAFASGTTIMWNAATFELMMRHDASLNRTLIDDVALGVLMNRLGFLPSNFSTRIYAYDNGTHSPLVWIPSTVHSATKPDASIEAELVAHGRAAIAFRHHAFENRMLDVKLMALTLRHLLRWLVEAVKEE